TGRLVAEGLRPSRSCQPSLGAAMNLTVKIKRFNPDVDKKPHWETYQIDADPQDRFVDVLNEIKWRQDGTLTFRRSCVHGVCGSASMRLNGRNMLACKTLVQELGEKISVEPMLGYPVIKDLVVDMDPFMAKYEKVMPFLVNDEPVPHTERLQTPEQRARYD